MRRYNDIDGPSKSPYVKYDGKGFLKLGGFILFLGLGFLLMIHFLVVPKDPITADQAEQIMQKLGYSPQDVTEAYYKSDPNFQSALSKCIAFETADIHFEFFEFLSDNDAIDLYGQAYTKIIRAKDGSDTIKTHEKIANFVIFTLDDHETYNVAIYVGNTAVYAYANSEQKAAVNQVLDKMDYLESSIFKRDKK